MAKRTCRVEGCEDPGHARRQQRYSFDDAYFDSVDTEAKAYWLGFVTADGCVHAGPIGTSGWQRHSLVVKLKASDTGHLEKLKVAMAAENPVYPVPQRTSGKPAVEIALSSPHLTDSLIRLDVTPQKSLTATPWNGPDQLMRHYWRGMFDGDGTIVKHADDRNWHLRMLGTDAVVEAFRSWAVALTGSAAKKYPKANIWSFTLGGLASPQILAREMYGGSTVYLDRKYELAHQLMAVPVRHRSWLVPGVAADDGKAA